MDDVVSIAKGFGLVGRGREEGRFRGYSVSMVSDGG